MPARLLEGRVPAARIREDVRARARPAGVRAGLVAPPRLAIFRAGEDAAAAQYLRSTRRLAAGCGIETEVETLPADAGEQEFLAAVEAAGARSDVDAVQVLKPVPGGRHVSAVLEVVPPAKDVEGVHPENMGLLLLGRPRYVPCTAAAVMALLAHHELPLGGRRAVVIGRSDTVGKPLAALLLAQHATVTVCHSVTADLEDEVRRADVLVAAIGSPELVKASWVKPGAVVVDLAHHVLEDGRTVGDVEATVAGHAGALTPVPGGAGPLTVAMLLHNVVLAFELGRGAGAAAV